MPSGEPIFVSMLYSIGIIIYIYYIYIYNVYVEGHVELLRPVNYGLYIFYIDYKSDFIVFMVIINNC